MNINNCFLNFKNEDGETEKVSINDILISGVPCDEEGKELELASEEIEFAVETLELMNFYLKEVNKRFDGQVVPANIREQFNADKEV